MRTIVVLLFLSTSIVSQSQTADEIIHRHLENIGGEAKWKKVKSLITKGEYDYGGIVFPFTTYAKSPNQYKFVVPFEGKFYAQGYDGTSGWKIDAFKNETTPTLLEGRPAVAMANEADVELENTLINYEAKGHQITFFGTDTVAGKIYYKISILKSDDQNESYFFDPTDYTLQLKNTYAKNVELESAELTTYFSDYKYFHGLKIACKQISKIGDQTILTVTVKDVILNPEIKDDEFKPMKVN
jgi:hypothetical protein